MIRGLTLTHPWAFCIAHAGKDVENRSWRPEKQGGQVGMYLAIHGGVMPTGTKKREALADIAYVATQVLTPSYIHHSLSTEQLHRLAECFKAGEEALFTPGIVAVARLAAVTTDGISPWKVSGQYQWELTEVATFTKPVPHKGAQGLWEIEPDALAHVRERWAASSQLERQPSVDTTPVLTGQVCGTCGNGQPTRYPNEVECTLPHEIHDRQPKGYNQRTQKADIPVHLPHGDLLMPVATPDHRCRIDAWRPRP